jgi:hypothetical protein
MTGPAVTPPPPASPNPQTPRNRPPLSPNEERFPTPSSSSSEDVPTTPNTRGAPRPPSTPRARGTPRSGPHSPSRRRVARAPAGNKNRKEATDVRTFFTVEEGMHVCLFCTYVFFFLFLFSFNHTETDGSAERNMPSTRNIWSRDMERRQVPVSVGTIYVKYIPTHG